jgi:sortase A
VSDLMLTPSTEEGLPPSGQAVPSRSSRAVRGLALALIVAGALVVADVAVTLVWQEPITALIATLRQEDLSGDLQSLERAEPTGAQRQALAGIPDERKRIAYLARQLEAQTAAGAAVGRIVIPRIGESKIVVKGTGTEELKSGPGIYPQTHFPGLGGTTAIAGHRTTYLAPFRDINELSTGSVIRLEMPYAQFIYDVEGERVVLPTDVQAAEGSAGFARLVLSACTPLFSAEKRLLVYARLIRTIPEGAARDLPQGLQAQPIEPQPLAPGAGVRPPLPPVLKPLDGHLGAPLV